MFSSIKTFEKLQAISGKYLSPRRYLNYGWRKFYYVRARLNLPSQVDITRKRWLEFGDNEMIKLRARTLEFIARCHCPTDGIGAYSFKPGGPAILYASCYAALTLHLYGELQRYPKHMLIQWGDYLNSFQGNDGVYRDPRLACTSAEQLHWWGWYHLTLHVLMALRVIGTTAARLLTPVELFRHRGSMASWLRTRNWKKEPANVSNQIQNIGTMLQYSRDFQEQVWCQRALEEMYAWLDKHQDNSTGSWWARVDSAHGISKAVQTGYHIWMLYFYDGRPLKHTERIIEYCLKTQNCMGGFGVVINSSACEDIDSIDPLVRLMRLHGYRNEIYTALERALYWVLANFNDDGGAVFRRYEPLWYGHHLMSGRSNEATMFPTWFRTLSLAYIGQALPDTAVGRYRWHFLRTPGHQFFFPPEEKCS